MLKVLLARLGQGVLVLLAVSAIAFAMFRYVGDPVLTMSREDATPQEKAELRAFLGLDQPVPVQYAKFLWRVVRADLGISYRNQRPVFELIAQRLERFAGIVGADRIIGSTDCGFGTFAGYGKIDPLVTAKNLKALREGADLAAARV